MASATNYSSEKIFPLRIQFHLNQTHFHTMGIALEFVSKETQAKSGTANFPLHEALCSYRLYCPLKSAGFSTAISKQPVRDKFPSSPEVVKFPVITSPSAPRPPQGVKNPHLTTSMLANHMHRSTTQVPGVNPEDVSVLKCLLHLLLLSVVFV